VAPLALAATATPASADTEHVSRTMALDAGRTLTLKSFSGRVTITGSDRTDVSIEATRIGTREALDRNKLEIDGDRSRLRIVENGPSDRFERGDSRDRVVETQFTIQVPRRLNLDLDLFGASLDVRNVDGDHTVKIFTSAAHLDNVNGSIRAKSFSGSLEIRQTNWRERGSIDVETFSGRIDLRLAIAYARGWSAQEGSPQKRGRPYRPRRLRSSFSRRLEKTGSKSSSS
jgi:hypothetical protein